jgi:dihydroorotase
MGCLGEWLFCLHCLGEKRLPEVWIRGGKLFDGEGFKESDLAVSQDRIRKVGDQETPPLGARVIDAGGRYVGPAFVDLHTHSRTPGKDGSETADTLVRAAALGGYCFMVAMANTDPVVDSVDLYKDLTRAFARYSVEVLQAASVTKRREGNELVDMVSLHEAGAVFFSDDGDVISDARLMKRALEYSRRLGVIVAEHAQDERLSYGGVMNEGEISSELGVSGIPEDAESVVVARDLELNRVVKGNLHLMHLSSLGSIELLRHARSAGIPFSSEVTPHHLLLNDSELRGFDTNYKVNPPLRSEQTRRALLRAFSADLFDVVGTDHAPHARHLKERSIREAPFGLIGLQSAFSATISALVDSEEGDMVNTEVDTSFIEESLALIFRKMAVAPRRILESVAGVKAKVPAYVVVDPSSKSSLQESDLVSMSKNSPYIGRELRGSVVSLVIGENVLVDEGRLVEEGIINAR